MVLTKIVSQKSARTPSTTKTRGLEITSSSMVMTLIRWVHRSIRNDGTRFRALRESHRHSGPGQSRTETAGEELYDIHIAIQSQAQSRSAATSSAPTGTLFSAPSTSPPAPPSRGLLLIGPCSPMPLSLASSLNSLFIPSSLSPVPP
jgi:hypothetical protein